MLKTSKNSNHQVLSFYLIALGAFIGSVLRWYLEDIFLVNIIGTAMIGFLYGLNLSKKVIIFLGIGLCGSLTTFSGWIIESKRLIFTGEYFQAFYNTFVTLGFSICIFFLTYFLAEKIRLLKPFR